MLLTSQAKANRTLIRNKKRYVFAIRNFTLFQNTHKDSLRLPVYHCGHSFVSILSLVAN